MGAVHVIGDHDPQHRVAEELEPLVRVVAGVLGTPGAVHQGRREEVEVDVEAEAFDELLESRDREGDQDPYSRPTT
jgi:hypothetical protein